MTEKEVEADSRLHVLWDGTLNLNLSEHDEIEILLGYPMRQPSNHDVRASGIINLTRGGNFFSGSMPLKLEPPLCGYVEDIRKSKNHTEFYLIEKGSTGESKTHGRVWEYLGITKETFWSAGKWEICFKDGCDRALSPNRGLCRYHLGAYHRWLKKRGVKY